MDVKFIIGRSPSNKNILGAFDQVCGGTPSMTQATKIFLIIRTHSMQHRYVFALLTAAAIGLLVVGCSQAKSDGQYFVSADELPEEVQSLIVHLQKLDGTAPTLIEFGTHIHAQGLHLEPDHWKDFYYQWRIPTRNDNERYVLFGHFSRKSEAELRLWEASIRGDDGEVWSSATRFHHQDNQASRQNGGPLAEVARVGRETHACHVSVSRGHRAAETRLPSRQEQSTISTALMSQRCSTGRTISAIPRTLEVAEDASTDRSSGFLVDAALP